MLSCNLTPSQLGQGQHQRWFLGLRTGDTPKAVHKPTCLNAFHPTRKAGGRALAEALTGRQATLSLSLSGFVTSHRGSALVVVVGGAGVCRKLAG